MRESIGGAWLFSIVITFIALFSIFLTFAIKYSLAFKYKNQILDIIERDEGWVGSERITDWENVDSAVLDVDNSTEAKAFRLSQSLNYDSSSVANIERDKIESLNHENEDVKPGGYCITKFCSATGNKNQNTYYKVTTFISIPFPFI